MSHIYLWFLLILLLSYSHQRGKKLYIILDFIMNLFVLLVWQVLLWLGVFFACGLATIGWHWSAFLASWLSKKCWFNLNLYGFVSNILALGLGINGLAFICI